MLNAKRIAKIHTINFGVLIPAPVFYLLIGDIRTND